MEFDNLFLVAVQSSLVLGLVHGVNPCGHSWLVLAPFVSGEKNGKRVSALTVSFIMGTALACLAIGWSLGAVSAGLSDNIRFWADAATNVVLIILGTVLILKPQILHRHEGSNGCLSGHCRDQGQADLHRHDHDHHDDQDHDHDHAHGGRGILSRFSKVTVTGLFAIGFVNMIIPCPTAAIMYSYAIESGSALRSTLVFGAYAVSTGVALAAVIYAVYRITSLVRRLNQHWIENLIMRTMGCITVFFGIYSLIGA